MTVATHPALASSVDSTSAGRSRKVDQYPALEKGRRRAGWLLVAPAALHIFVWITIPVVVSLWLSLTDYRVIRPPRWIGLDNYREIWHDDVFRTALWNTAVYTFFTVPASMALAVVIAAMLNQQLALRTWYRTAFFLPHVTATVAVAMVWIWMYQPNVGVFNALLQAIGIDGPNWLSDPDWAMPSVIILGVWQGIGFKMLIYLAALQGISRQFYDAAAVDGAGRIRQFFHITLPLLKPATFFVLVIATIDAFQVFDQIYVMTRGGPVHATTTVTYEIYESAFQAFRLGLASAKAVVLFVMIFAVTIISRRLVGRDEE